MSTPVRLIAFAAVLGLVFGGAALAGAAIDPTDSDETTSMSQTHGAADHTQDDAASGAGAQGGGHAAMAGGATATGLAVSEGGFTLRPERTFFEADQPARFAFRITDAQGRVVRVGYEPTHERELHLIVVRRDTAVFEHVHPRRAADGTWSVDLRLREPGTYRVYADFKIDGQARTLATDVFVPGDFRPKPLPAPDTTDEAAGYQVELRAGEPRAGREGELAFAVTRDGRPAENLEDYLGANGHLVALREGDLAYLHVHPTAAGEAHEHAGGEQSTEAHGNEIKFAATFPTAGRYRLFLQFKTDGEIRTVAYTLEVPR
ncbi:MAG: hypothetical protein M3R09_00250 [Actinomycetota bacterium]|nr:hypothetical protein [Actinomycetota bacterium]